MDICSHFPIAQKVFRISLIIILFVIAIKNLDFLPKYSGDDLNTFITSAKNLQQNPYFIDTQSPPGNFMGIDFYGPNLNPPAFFMIFGFLKYFDLGTILPYWRIGSFIFYIISIVLLTIAFPKEKTIIKIVWLLALGGLWDCLGNGQIYMPLLLFCSLAWILLPKRPIIAGFFIGILVAIKPFFLVWIVLLLLARYFKAGLSAAITFVSLSLLPVLFYGARIYSQYIAMNVSGLGPPVIYSTNSSIIGFFSRFVDSWVGIIFASLTLLALAYIAWRYKPNLYIIGALGLIGGALASPISWISYDVLFLPVLISSKWNKYFIIAAALLTLLPSDIYYASITSNLHLLFWGSLMFFIQILILFGTMSDFYRNKTYKNSPKSAGTEIS